jgi:hypothetical protein
MGSAINIGMIGGLQGFLLSAIAVTGLNHYHKGFRTSVGVSGKVASIVMPTIFMCVYDIQQDVVRQNKTNWRRQVVAANEKNDHKFASPKR